MRKGEVRVLICPYLQSVLLNQSPVALLELLAHVNQLDAWLDETLCVPSDLPVRYTTPRKEKEYQ